MNKVTMEERLTEIIGNYFPFRSRDIARKEAKHLISKGVIVLPCELGTVVYCLAQPCGGCKNYNEPMKEEFIEECRKCDKWQVIECDFDYDLIPEFGKTVFLTKEEAEKELTKKGK